MIQFDCQSCQKRYKVGDELAGKKVKCRECAQIMQIPVLAEADDDDEPLIVAQLGGPPMRPQPPPTARPQPSPISRPQPAFAALASQRPPLQPQATSSSRANASSKNLSGTTADLSYEISQRPDFALVRIKLQAGRKILAEPSAMVSMTPSVKLEAGIKGGLGKTFGKLLGGESLITNTFTAENEPGEIMFAGGSAGDVAYQRLEGQTLYLQRGAYMLNTEGVEVTGKWQGAKGFFGGEGLVLLKASGYGDLFFNSYGAILEVDVTDGFIVDSGYIVAFEETLDYHVTVLPGLRSGGKIKSLFFGGEGLVCEFSGFGRVWIQTRQVSSFLAWSNVFRPAKSN